MTQSDSEIVTASLTLQGVWLHDPSDPAGTVRQYLFGGTGRTSSPAAGSTELRFVGRVFPVYEFGEDETEDVRTTVQVPHGLDWAEQRAALLATARSKRVWCYRDNRGRRVFGVLGVRDSDQAYGSAIDLTVDRADFNEAV